MKKYIIVRLVLVVVCVAIVVTLFSTAIFMSSAVRYFETTALMQIDQTIEVLEDNAQLIEELDEDLKNDYIIRARATAYMLQQNPDAFFSVRELGKIASLLQVDEIHLFNEEGQIFAGTHPSYYGYTVDSGEQINFFKPMLENKRLELVQDVTPNTAESRPVQYLAVWSETGNYFVQIGMNPVRLLEAKEKTELSHIFAQMAPSIGETIFAVDSESHIIIASTDEKIIGQHTNSIGINSLDSAIGKSVKTSIDNENGHSIFKSFGSILVGVNLTDHSLYNIAFTNTFLFIICGLVIGTAIVFLIYTMLDRIVIRGISELSEGMSKIADGDLNFKFNVSGLPEFVSLSEKANHMLQSIYESSRKFSTIFQYVDMPLALYEHRSDKLYVTSKMGEILEDKELVDSNVAINAGDFLKKIENIMKYEYSKEVDTYIYNINGKEKYLKIKLYSEETSNWGIIHDITDRVNEILHIRHERDIDFLTSIYNRRAFLEELDSLATQQSVLKKAALVMMDLDNLKHVNDTWGHLYGDIYISKAAEVLKNFAYEQKVVARLSGDEFVILLYGAESNEELSKQVELLELDFSKASITNPDETEHPISLSGGYAFYPEHATRFRDILQLADLAMYEVKKSNKGKFKMYTK